jgi:hypothetical protein
LMPGPEMLCVYQFKVVLRGISPMIWRRLLLRARGQRPVPPEDCGGVRAYREWLFCDRIG